MRKMSKKRIYGIKFKNGVSKIALVITILLSVIIVSIVMFSTKNAIDNASLATFSKDLTDIQNAVQSYYEINKIYPILYDSKLITKDELLLLSPSKDLLIQELTENDDLESTFHIIDLSKINITKTAYGTKKLGEGDIFVVANPSMNVYYPYGLTTKGTKFFSITSKISNVLKVQKDKADAVKTISSSDGIKVTQINGWTNKMGVNIEVDMGIEETLYMSVSGASNRLITTTEGKNTFGFNLLSSIVADTETIKVPTLTAAEADYIELGTKPLADRYVDILKYKGSDLIGKVRIDLSNFCKISPTIKDVKLTSYPIMNTLELQFNISESGIKEVRYEYLTKYTDDGTIENYYTGATDFDSVYMQSKAKKAKLSKNLEAIINAPKNVQSIKIAVIDNAGNVSYYNQKISQDLYIGYTLDIATTASLQLTAKMFSTNGIKTIAFSKSLDGINFTDEQIYTLDTTTNGITSKQCIPYENFVVSNVYIKMVAVNYDSTITETRIKKINLSSVETKPVVKPVLGVNVIASENTTVNGEIESYTNPIIPKGFKAINDGVSWPTDWNKGLVIEDSNGNQFVWIPVDGTNVTYAKWCTSGISYLSTSNDTLPSGVTSEMNQITKYGGFYIARYEIGKENSINPVSKKNATIWNNINYTDSKTKAESMYTTEIKSGLVTGTQWDTVMKWLESSGKNITTDSRKWGNYSNSITPSNVIGYGKIQVSGYSEYWKANNIYDLAGNTYEWTMEMSSKNYISRGGSYNVKGDKQPASYRDSQALTYKNVKLGFRTVLYIN